MTALVSLLTNITIPQILSTKQQRDPIGPHKQNTTFPAISPALAIFASQVLSTSIRSSIVQWACAIGQHFAKDAASERPLPD